jgi:hypothetical protein
MSLALLLPAGLAALAALLLPLLLHLARRSEQRPTVFAALQWLRAKPRPRHRLRFDEWPLLVVRLLLLALLALLLARPVLLGAARDGAWVAVAPGVELPPDRATLAPPGARWHWLAPDFPALDAAASDPAVPATQDSISSLLRELDASLPGDVALTVLVPPVLDGVDAQRPALGRRVDWRVLPGATPAPRPAQTWPAPRLSVRHAPQRESGLRYLRAAHAAWHPTPTPAAAAAAARQDVAPVTQPLAADARHLVWLAPGPVPPAVLDRVRAGAVALLDAQAELPDALPMVALWRDADGGVLVEGAGHGQGRLMRLTRALTPQAMPVLLDADFPDRLRTLFEPAPAAPARVLAVDHAPSEGGPVFAPAPQDLQPWLLVLIAALFGLERWIATGRRRGAAP